MLEGKQKVKDEKKSSLVYVYMNKGDMKKLRKLERGGDEKERYNEGFR